MKITEEQKQRILKLDPNFFDIKLELGKWYKAPQTKNIVFIVSENEYYGFISNEWTIHKSNTINYNGLELATQQEVETYLITEANKRGYKDGVLTNKGIIDLGFLTEFKLYSNEFWRGGYLLFKDGVWAKIIETITLKEAEKLLNKKIV